MEELRLSLPEEADGERADRFLFGELGDEWSRTDIQRWFADGRVSLRGKELKKSASLRTGDTVTVSSIPPKPTSELLPEPIPLRILFEDDHLVVIDKPKGLTVHPGSGIKTGTLAAALLYRYREQLSTLNGPLRPGIVHRLDRETSGVMVAAKSDLAHRGLSEQIRNRTCSRTYRAIAWGNPTDDAGVFEGNIGRDPVHRLRMAVIDSGKPARTHFEVVERWIGAAEWELKLDTGRTHQIRVHLAAHRHPVVGDPLYGGREEAVDRLEPMERQLLKPLLKLCNSQLLQSVELRFLHPITGEPLRFSPPPEPELEAARQFLREATQRIYPEREER